MTDCYESDLCITRAGATSLAEISLMEKPFIAIPLPSAKDNHQMDNAKFFMKLKDVVGFLNQKNLNQDNLLKLLLDIINNNSEYTSKRENLKKVNYKNSWNEINQKLNRIINEN